MMMQAFLEAYELWETVTEDKPFYALPENPTLDQIKFNNKERTKKSKSLIAYAKCCGRLHVLQNHGLKI